MGNSSSNTNKLTQEFYNNVIQSASAVCGQNCDQASSNNVYYLNDSNIDKAGISQKCSINAECVMSNELSNIIENTATARASQSNDTTQSMVSFTFSNLENNNQMTQGYNNYVTQAMNASCQSSATQISSNNIFFVQNSEVGVLGISQDADLVTQCYMNNLALSTVQNVASAEVDQSNKVKSAFAMIVVAIAICLIVGGIMFLVIFMGPSMGGGGEGKDGKKGSSLSSLAPLFLL